MWEAQRSRRMMTVMLSSVLLSRYGLVSAQTTDGAPANAQVSAPATSPRSLTIVILEGEAELNDVRARTAREPIVEVQDENHKPVAGALVLFSIDSGGGTPGATFSGLDHLALRTGTDGRAVGRGFTVTRQTGNLRINVQASYNNLTANAQVHQTNYAHGHSAANHLSQIASSKATLAIVLEVAAFAAVASTFVVTSRDPSSTTITPTGTGPVGAP